MVGHLIPVTTFFVFSKPLCSHSAVQCRSWFGNFLHRCKSTVYRCQRTFHCSPNLWLLQRSALQLFCSASWSHSAALQQRCLFRAGIVILEVLEQNNFKFWKKGYCLSSYPENRVTIYNFISCQWLAKININYYTVKEQKMERKSFKILKISLVSYSAERKWNHRVTKICF